MGGVGVVYVFAIMPARTPSLTEHLEKFQAARPRKLGPRQRETLEELVDDSSCVAASKEISDLPRKLGASPVYTKRA